MWWTTQQKIKTVSDMYEYSSENELPLLSSFLSAQPVLNDFWQPYVTDYETYDKIFRTMFKSYFYFDQEGDETVEEIFNRFTEAVEGFLTLNDKKYTEMFRIELLSVDSDSVLSDYIITETKEGDREVERWYVSGARQDTSENTSGARTDTTTDQIMAFNSSQFADQAKSTYAKGEEEDSSEYNKGSQTDQEEVSESNDHTITTSGTKGNPYENMTKYLEAWDGYSFYTKVFKDIAANLLLV